MNDKGRWAIVNESHDGKECVMAYADTRWDAAEQCREFERDCPTNLELIWYIRKEFKPSFTFHPAAK